MTYQNDPNRLDDRTRTGDGMGWGIPVAIAAVVIIAGLLFFNSSGDRTTTASNNAPSVTQTTPSGPERTAPAPAPAPTPPTKVQ